MTLYKVSVLTQYTLQHTHKGFKPTESSLSEENSYVYVCVMISNTKGVPIQNSEFLPFWQYSKRKEMAQERVCESYREAGMVYCSCGARGVSRVALDTPDIWSVTPKMYMLLFNFLCLIVLKEAFILAVNSRMQVMRCVRCPASRFITSISSLSRAFAPHVQWAELTEMTEQEKKSQH